MNGLLLGWAKAGEGKPKDAIAEIEDGRAGLVPHLQVLQSGRHCAGRRRQVHGPLGKLNDAVLDREGGAAPDTFMRAVVCAGKA
jgi:hypothetical protein